MLFFCKRKSYAFVVIVIAPNFDKYSHNDKSLGIRYDTAKEENRREKEREMRARKDSSYKSTYVSKFSSLKLMQLLKLQSNFPA